MRVLNWIGGGFAALHKFRRLCLRHYWIGTFAEAGPGISIGDGLQLYGPKHIRLGHGVSIANHVTLRALTGYPWTDPPQTFSPEIVLEDRCFINNFSQISCVNRVVIGANTMIAEGCFIADNNHGYDDPDNSIREQPLRICGEVHVGPDSWIGAHCVIVGNIRIGRHCVIGANSVVTSDLPDFSIAAGAPARILKQFDPVRKQWLPPAAS